MATQTDITKSRYLNIDALRGIAAFAVVLFHLPNKEAFYVPLNIIATYGYTGVYLFFVISGFCIHLRWAKAKVKGVESPKIDFFAFWKRRWLRLYPAYLVAMALFLVWQYYQGLLTFNELFAWDMVSHLLMIHNFDNRVVYSMNGVFWTLAIEEQLYLIYFLLLWMRQKWGWAVALIVCFMARILWLPFVLIANRTFQIEIPFAEGVLANWWIWALGALAVENYLGIIKLPRWCYSMLLSAILVAIGGFLHYQSVTFGGNWWRVGWVIEAPLLGAGFFLLINWAMQYENKLKSVFAARAVSIWAGIGLFSYSLYLTHELILQLLAAMSPIILIIASIIFAYLFYFILEKPFMIYLSKQKR